MLIQHHLMKHSNSNKHAVSGIQIENLFGSDNPKSCRRRRNKAYSPVEGAVVECVSDAETDFDASSEIGFPSTLISTLLHLCGVDFIMEDSV